MGLHGENKKVLLATPATRQALLKPEKGTKQIKIPIDGRYGSIVDTCAWLYTLRQFMPDEGKMSEEMTGQEFFDIMWAQPLQELEGNCMVRIWIVDANSGIPVRKLPTQVTRGLVGMFDPAKPEKKKRARKADAPPPREPEKPYPDGTTFINQGMLLPGGKIELVKPSRVAKSRGLRRSMGNYMLGKIFGERGVPAGRFVILDYLGQAPVLLTRGSVELMWHLRHNIGEADVQAAYWMRVLREGIDLVCGGQPLPMVIKTSDTDFIPVLVNYIATTGIDACPPIYLTLGNAAKKTLGHEEVWDVKALARAILFTLGVTARRFIVSCILGGTDFVPKDECTAGVGAQKILKYVMENCAMAATDLALPVVVADGLGEQVWTAPPQAALLKPVAVAPKSTKFAGYRDKVVQKPMDLFVETKQTAPAKPPLAVKSTAKEWQPILSGGEAKARVRHAEFYEFVTEVREGLMLNDILAQETVDKIAFNLCYWGLDWSLVPNLWRKPSLVPQTSDAGAGFGSGPAVASVIAAREAQRMLPPPALPRKALAVPLQYKDLPGLDVGESPADPTRKFRDDVQREWAAEMDTAEDDQRVPLMAAGPAGAAGTALPSESAAAAPGSSVMDLTGDDDEEWVAL